MAKAKQAQISVQGALINVVEGDDLGDYICLTDMTRNFDGGGAKINNRVHTDAIKDSLSAKLTREEERWEYANEADMLNAALFGLTASKWKNQTRLSMAIFATMRRSNNCSS